MSPTPRQSVCAAGASSSPRPAPAPPEGAGTARRRPVRSWRAFAALAVGGSLALSGARAETTPTPEDQLRSLAAEFGEIRSDLTAQKHQLATLRAQLDLVAIALEELRAELSAAASGVDAAVASRPPETSPAQRQSPAGFGPRRFGTIRWQTGFHVPREQASTERNDAAPPGRGPRRRLWRGRSRSRGARLGQPAGLLRRAQPRGGKSSGRSRARAGATGRMSASAATSFPSASGGVRSRTARFSWSNRPRRRRPQRRPPRPRFPR